jgi:bifunctional non-homologous end joining protein LigD
MVVDLDCVAPAKARKPRTVDVALETYRAKRNFKVTPEPRGAKAGAAGHRFVIQKHAARRLHYDLRLELDGVMKSWAVTRGPSLVPGEKRLAVEVEDHPIAYNDFEGTIPHGQYGGGTVMIWDRGTWQPEGDPHKSLSKGHLSFTLDGDKLQGTWHLVRLRGRPRESRTNWLLIKSKDKAARSEGDPDILEERPLSVVTGRSIPEIAEGKGRKRVWQSNRSVEENVKAGATRGNGSRARPKKAARSPRQAGAAKPTKKKAKTRRASSQGASPSRRASRGAPLPDFVPMCLAGLGEQAPADAGWLHEIKFDGYRVEARLDHGEVKLLTRKGLDWTAKFPPVAEAVAELDAEQALLDGEIISETENGLSSFSQLQQDLSDGRTDRMVYYAFDLLHLDGRDLTGAPLIERKQALHDRLGGPRSQGPLRFSAHFEESGPVLLKHACQLGLEGIVSKRKTAPYRSGRGGDWIKTKCTDRQEFVIAGYAASTVDSKAIGALILGYYEGDKLHYAGRSGTGYSHKMARDLWNQLQPLRIARPAFGAVPPEETRARNATWVEPRLIAEVSFRGWTHGDRVRQASFQGLREDKAPQQVVRENKAMTPVVKKEAAAPARSNVVQALPRPNAGRRAARSSSASPAPGAEHRSNAERPYTVELSHPDRVYWEDARVTKQGLADYYVEVWDWMAPHLVGRPLALVRCPEGAGGECFFQKHANAGIDQKRLRLVPEPDGDHVITVGELDGLISLVQAGVLEIHTRGTTADSLETADRLVFDLDPGPGTAWQDIVDAAREVRDRLDDIGFVSFLKTSGGKGLHVVLPIAPTPWDDAKGFARSVAEAMAADDPSRYTATIKKTSREKRIFVDYLRNSREATAVAPYSTRARPGAPVSTPIGWDELPSHTGGNRYTVLNLHQRLARLRKDPWADIGRLKQLLPAAKGKRR